MIQDVIMCQKERKLSKMSLKIEQVGSSGLNSYQAESGELNKVTFDGSSRREVQDKDNIWHGWSPAALKTKMSDALITKKGEPNMASQEKTKGFNSRQFTD
ncbi:unnamed protein product [Parnassius apollo]|uniref:(apollo) hypothetical protein n=1 Tax=Parnassius apollo TaxID=110799 RepID=A0A8S3XWA0_PARAO|nr:unnamed protein product [Parnassius apollo]